MFTLSKEFRFEASHQLPAHDGKCARLHGHSWVGWVYCQGPELQTTGPKAGMLIDFADLKTLLKPLLEEHLDHHHLNETTGLANPTSEELARWIYKRLKPQLPSLLAVEIRETCTSRCRYQPS
jgi:6-pyruvoyltetrahydropterin/6-carboxytetrahydropterin synthase